MIYSSKFTIQSLVFFFTCFIPKWCLLESISSRQEAKRE